MTGGNSKHIGSPPPDDPIYQRGRNFISSACLAPSRTEEQPPERRSSSRADRSKFLISES
jgi:hypothetical protein